MITNLRKLLAYEPAALAWSVNGGLALLLAFVFHATKTEQAAATTILTAAAAAVTAWKAVPAKVSVVLGALTTAVTAAGAFGFHPSAQLLATLAAAGSAVLPWVMRVNLTPKASAAEPPHEAEHAAPVVHHVRMAEEDLEALGNRLATKVATAVRPVRPPRRPSAPGTT